MLERENANALIVVLLDELASGLVGMERVHKSQRYVHIKGLIEMLCWKAVSLCVN